MTELAVIFDMDGVLVDSNAAHFETFQRLGAELGTPFPADLWARSIGMHNNAIFPMWLGDGLSRERVLELATYKEAMYREHAADILKPVTGAPELVRALKTAGVPIAVGSSGPRLNVELALRVTGTAELFDVVITGDDVRHGKPDPEIFLTAAHRLGVDPSVCVVIEDAPQGVKAALAAEMKVVGLLTSCSPDQLPGAHLYAASHAELSADRLRALVKRGT